ncbi:MAG TPA: heavy metal-responsive transcriptional regulator [Vicinamibacterales bacterium]|nr:heavy metal-responsive transcriptional regulator [Vicinamibacterales bacterium]
MSTSLGPRDVADATGVSTDTLRYYERKGLLPPPARSCAGYRRYPPSAVERVLLIQRALVVGFTLGDLKRVLTLRDRGGVPCQGVRELVGTRLQQLNDRIDELTALREELQQLLAEWDDRLAETPSGKRAHLLETLGSKPLIETARHRRRAVKRNVYRERSTR